VPCDLTNVEGTVHPDIIKPSWDYPCTICKDHRQAQKMLLCDGCNLGFHTYCLPIPLAEVPDGVWLCHTCLAAGVTERQVNERRERYVHVEQARPRIELPGNARRKHARALADKWHGVPVKHVKSGKPRFGRVTFTDVSEAKWFKIYWTDGTESWHDTRILARLEVIAEEEAPPEMIHRPEPAVVMIVSESPPYTWSIQTLADIQARLRDCLRGEHSYEDIVAVFQSLRTDVRKAMTKQSNPKVLQILNAVVDFRDCKVILDPWAGNKAVEKGLEISGSQLILNDKLGRVGVNLRLEPLEAPLYHRVLIALGRLDAIVMCPPRPLMLIALINAMEFASQVVCMLVHDDWLTHIYNDSAHPLSILMAQLHRENRLVIIKDDSRSGDHAWICVFSTHGYRCRLTRREFDVGESAIVVCESSLC